MFSVCTVASAGSTPARLRRRAFTLIELLVVIAIIAILAAILFPVFAKAREKARQISCLSNEKQLALGLIQYQQDYDESFPNHGNGQGGTGWGSRTYPYVKSTGVFKCPDDSTTPVTTAGITYYPVSYAMNANAGYDQGIAGLNAPASTVMLTEVQGATADVTNVANDSGGYVSTHLSPAANGGDGGGAGWIDWTAGCTYATGPSNLMGMGNPQRNTTRNGLPRHTDGANFALADGHAKYLRAAQVSPGGDNNNAACDQDMAGSPCTTSTGTAAGTGFMGTAPKNFVVTYSVK